jgi:hypothetical protein
MTSSEDFADAPLARPGAKVLSRSNSRIAASVRALATMSEKTIEPPGLTGAKCRRLYELRK